MIRILGKIVKKLIRLIGIGIIVLFLVFLIGSLAFYIPSVQKKAAKKLVSFVEKKTGADASVGKISLLLPGKISIDEIYLPDANNDTLFKAGFIGVHFNPFKLMRNEIRIGRVTVKQAKINLHRTTDSTFNFQYLIDGFSGGNKTVKEQNDTSKKAFGIHLGKIILRKVRFKFNDEAGKSFYNASLGKFRVKVNALDPGNSQFELSAILLQNSSISLEVNEKVNKKPESPKIDIGLERKLKLRNVNFELRDNYFKQEIDLHNANLDVIPNKLYLPEYLIDLKSVKLTGTEIGIHKKRISPEDSLMIVRFQEEQYTQPFPWNILIGKIILESNQLHLSNENTLNPTRGVDFSDLKLMEINGLLEQTGIKRNFLSTDIDHLSLTEQSGFTLNDFSVSFRFTEQKTEFSQVMFSTPHSSVSNSLTLYYPSVAKLQEDPLLTRFNLHLGRSELAVSDVLYFQPLLYQQLKFFSDSTHKIFIEGNVQGRPDSLSFESIRTGYDSTLLVLNGSVNGLPDIHKSYFDVGIDTLYSTSADIRRALGDSILPENLNLPGYFMLQSKFRGSFDYFKASAEITSSYGNTRAEAELTANRSSGTMVRNMMAKLNIGQFELGKLLGNDTIGQVTLNVSADGTIAADSFSNPDILLDMGIDSMELLGYNYRNFKLNGQYTKNRFDGTAEITDTNLVFNFKGIVDLSDSLPHYNFLFNLQGADFYALHHTPSRISGRGKLEVDLTGNNADNLDGKINISNLFLLKNKKQYRLDSLTASIQNTHDSVMVFVQSRPLRASYSGTVKFGEFAKVMQRYVNRYYTLGGDSSVLTDKPEKYKLNIKVNSSDLLSDVLWPDLESFLPGTIESEFDASKQLFNLAVNLPQIKFKGNTVDSLLLKAGSADTNAINYSLGYSKLSAPPFIVSKTLVEGSVTGNKINIALRIIDQAQNDKFRIQNVLYSDDEKFYMQFNTDNLIINYNHFNLPDNNLIAFSDSGINFQHINLYSGEQEMLISKLSDNPYVGNGYTITLSNFAVSSLTGLFEARHDIVDGVINGDLLLGKNDTRSLYRVELQLSDILLFNETAFNSINLAMNNIRNNQVNIDTRFKGPDNSLAFTGTIDPGKKGGNLDLTLDIEKLELDHVYPFLKDEFKKLDGEMVGKIAFRGSMGSPEMEGKLGFKDATIFPAYVNTPLRLTGDEITIEKRKVQFDNFTLTDKLSNKATLNGNIDFARMEQPEIDLDFQSANFLFLNTTYDDNELYYGKILSDLNASITGTLSNPDINLDARFDNESRFFFVIPGLNTPSVEKEGLVRFIDKSDTIWSDIMLRNIRRSNKLASNDATFDLSANVEIDPGMEITIVIDPASNEELFVKGNANLSLVIKGGSAPNLTGRFEIAEGTYTLKLYDVIRRQLDIKKGSNLVWNGDITNALSDITAVYKVRTSPLPLIADETSQLTSEANTRYSNIMPFNVNLNLSGKLTQPTIDFDLETPPGQADALLQAKLSQLNQDESALNKQVFSLLLFNSFIQSSAVSDKPFAYELSSTARTSVSRLLTQQLNNFTARHIKGFNIDVGVNSYYQSTGNQASGRTEVSLDVSKELFNERLTVQLGGNFNVEDPQSRNEDLSSIAGDVIVEYNLDKEGTYRLRGFNVTEYEDIITGEVNKTGAAFIYNKDFFTFQNLFRTDSLRTVRREEKDTINANE